MDIQSGIQNIRALRTALEQQDLEGARQLQNSLNMIMEEVARSLRSRIESSQGIGNEAGREILFTMSGILSKIRSPLAPEGKKRNYAEEILATTGIENELMVLSAQAQNLKPLDAQLMLAPFSSKTQGIGKAQPRLAEYFSPAILILLLQYVGILFAAVSLVREYRGGKSEILRVSPLRNAELLMGKYIGCMILSAFAAALLTGLLVYGLQLPIMGDWRELIAILGAVLFSSLAIGFFISSLSRSEESAILFSMLLFITSIFFTGLFFDLNLLWRPLLFLSYTLPATYGIGLIQDVLLRGDHAGQISIALLLILGLAFILVASMVSRRRLAAA
jgi:ABC-2 type transport system permease protein